MSEGPQWRIRSQQLLFDNEFLIIRRTVAEDDARGTIREHFVHDGPDSVLCIALLPDGTIPLVRQFRIPVNSECLDFPAGSVETGDASVEQAVLRELREETGLTATSAQLIGVLQKDPGFSSARLHVFVARPQVPVDWTPAGNEGTVELLTVGQLLQEIAHGRLACSQCVAAMMLAQMHSAFDPTAPPPGSDGTRPS